MLSMELTPALAGAPHVGALADALRGERRLLQDLIQILAQQRSGVTDDDITAVDDSVFAAQRVLHTLSEARRRRRTLLTLITGREDLGLEALEGALGDDMTESLREARGDLQETARALAGELDLNRRILKGAISAGDRLIRALTGTPAPPAVYGAHGQSAGEARLLIDRQI